MAVKGTFLVDLISKPLPWQTKEEEINNLWHWATEYGDLERGKYCYSKQKSPASSDISDGLGYILLADSLIAYKNAEHQQNSGYLPVEFQIILFPKMVMLP